ncbi:MAG: amino acid adenylation domain-containing protein, partial [bacterium]|nr:amino acid adenylation domain-containing protein [bacterium]
AHVFPGVLFIILCCSTEASISSDFHPIHEVYPRWPSIPCGKLILTAAYYILDRNLELCPILVPGDLYIGGQCLASGYLNDPELTAGKFIDNPFVPDEKLYRTGDMARRHSGGNMEFLGRKDHQVKVRGFRIELGEIESQLLNHEEIENAVVLVRKDYQGDNFMCAYFVASMEMAKDELTGHLAHELPEYMIPLHFIQLEKIPLTPNGKVDRKTLPVPDMMPGSSEYTPPRDKIEEKLVTIWAEVLHIASESVSIDDNFFELGGHSLNAALVISRIKKELDVKIPLAEVFVATSVRKLADSVRGAEVDKYEAIEAVEKRDYYPLSPAQKRLYFLHKMDPGSISYNMPQVLEFLGELEPVKLERIFQRLIHRHETFRTSFTMVSGEPVQRIHDTGSLAFELKFYELEEEKADQLISDFSRPFDFSQPPLLRGALIKVGGERHILAVDLLHISADGVSFGILVRDFMALFEGKQPAPLRLQYKDFSQWQNGPEGIQQVKQQQEYWLKRFEDQVPAISLPTDYARPLIQNFEGETIGFALDKKESLKLKNIALSKNASIFMVLLATFNILLSKVSGSEDIIIGTGTAGRRHENLNEIIGMFVNTLALRNTPRSSQSFPEFLEELKKNSLQDFENQDYPFEDLVESLEIKRDTSRNPLFDVMFQLNNFEVSELEVPGLRVNGYNYKWEISKFDLTLWGWEREEQLTFAFEYATPLFKRETIDFFIRYFKEIITAVVQNPQARLGQLQQISPGNKEQLLQTLNQEIEAEVQRMMESEQVLQHRLARSFQKYENNIAIEYGTRTLTYGELDQYSNRVAREISIRGLGKGRLTGVLMDDRLELICAALGILKAGGVFVPLDTSYPQSRLELMVTSTDMKFIIAGPDQDNLFAGSHFPETGKPEIIPIDNCLNVEEPGNFSTLQPPDIKYQSEDPLYIYFTSGSTGTPRAILGKNSSLVHFIDWETGTFGIDETYRFSQLTTPGFDAFLRDLFVPLVGGCTVCIPESKEIQLEAATLHQWLEDSRVHLVSCVPSLFRLLASLPLSPDHFNELKVILLSGERITTPDLEGWLETFGDRVQLVNLWGTSETTLAKTYHIIQKKDLKRERIPVGQPIRGAAVMVLDENLEICDPLVAGQLYIRTPFRSFGYYNDSQSNSQRFIPNPFGSDPGDLIHKTGDMGRILLDGTIDLLGRNDRQIKIRGIRIEPGEIEALLQKQPSVKEAVVIKKGVASPASKGMDNEFLSAYVTAVSEVVSETPGETLVDTLAEYLGKNLPAYMTPSHISLLEDIPRTPNGKVDYEALMVWEDEKESYIAPGNKVEQKLHELWTGILKLERIGATDNFFTLGGNSLNVMNLISTIHREFDVRIPLADIFNNPTIQKQAALINPETQTEKYSAIQPVEKRDYYPMSSAQKRFYILQQVTPGSTSYNMAAIHQVDGHVEKERFADALNRLIKRHAGFRTSFEVVEEEPVQRVHEEVEFEIEYFDLATNRTYRHEGKNKKSIIGEFVRPFDLSQAPLLRLRLIEITDEQYILMFDMHHIISDGTSMAVFLKEFMTYYSGGDFQPLQLQYKDFAQWQYDRLASGELGKQETYWSELFPGELPVLDMATDFPRPPMQSFEGGKLYFKLEKSLTPPLNNLIKKTGTTLFMMLLAIYNVLLNRYTGQQDIIIGTTIAGRSHIDLENIIGLLIETLALRNNPRGEQTFEEFLNQVKQRTLQAYENQDYPFKELIQKVGAGNEISRNPIFDAMLIVQNMETTEFELEDLKFSPYLPPKGEEKYMSKVDFNLEAMESGEEIYFNLEYCSRLYKPGTMERFARHFINIVREVVAEPGIHLSSIRIISETEKQQLLVEFNNPEVETGINNQKTVLDRFEEQVAQTPDNIALMGTKLQITNKNIGSITYGELNNRADLLASTLIQKGVKPDTIVGIMVEPSLEMIIGLWGILKAGGAYLPIDPGYPQERIDFMLRDSNACVLLKSRKDQIRNPKSETNPNVPNPNDRNKNQCFPYIVLNFEHLDFEFVSNFDIRASDFQISSANLAYIIYTSGSTGRPKGVLVEHRNLTAYLHAFEKEFHLRSGDTVIQQVSFAFDAFVEELYPILVKGGKLAIPGKGVNKDIHRLCHFIARQQVTMITCSPQVLNGLNSQQPKSPLASLRIIISGGDRLKAEYIENLLEIGEVYNTYGPTESTVCVTYYKCPASPPLPSNVPIGKPITNYRVFVLDRYQNLLPIGVGGELCVSGPGVARGYLNQPGLTHSKFQISESSAVKIYKTGDLARWLPDGNVEFLGRIDHQVKVRGFRIEPGEIESHLLAHDEIQNGIVTVRKDSRGDNFLCAYFTSFREPGKKELKAHLSRELPEYMIPFHFIQLESIPLTANGNVDRKALPAPETQSKGPLIPPENDIQEKLAAIWSQVLGIEVGSIGIDSDFFELGGHSLNATMTISRIYKELEVKIPLAELFNSPSIRELAGFIGDHIGAVESEGFRGVPPAEQKEYHPLSSAQRRLYILQQMEPGSIAYNGLEAIILEGDFDMSRLEESIGLLMERHETLRTSIRMVNAEPVQVIHDSGEVDFSVAYYEAEGMEQAAVNQETCRGIMENFVCPFDLSHAPFLRLGLIKLGEDRYVLMFDIHHIITDGFSHEIFVKELMSLYTGIRLPQLPVQYKDYSEWQNSPRYQTTLANQESWWLSQFQTGDDIPVLVLPYDFPRPVVRRFEGDTINFQLSSEETGALRKLATDEGATLYMVLLTLFNILLFKLSSQEDIVVGAPVAGRPHADLEPIMGVFVNTLPLRNYPVATKPLLAFLRQLKESSLNAFENQDYQFEDLVGQVVNHRDTSRNPLFDAEFVLQVGMLERADNKEISIPGLTLKPKNKKNKS